MLDVDAIGNNREWPTENAVDLRLTHAWVHAPDVRGGDVRVREIGSSGTATDEYDRQQASDHDGRRSTV